MSTKPLAHQVVPGPDGAESARAAEGSTRPRDSLFHWCGTVDAIKNEDDPDEKRALLEAYFAAIADESVGPATRFFAGDIFAGSGTRVSWRLIAKAIDELTRLNAGRRRTRRIVQGDLSSIAEEAFAGRLPSGVSVCEVDEWASALVAAQSAETQGELLYDMLARLNSMEAKYLVSLLCGELGIGMSREEIEAAVRAARAPNANGRNTR
jgi:DNA ligase-1